MAGKIRQIVTCKTKEDLEPAKKLAEAKGGEILETYTIFPGFLVLMPDDAVSAFEGSEHIESVELDGVVTTQDKSQ